MTDADFISFVRGGAEACFADTGGIKPTIFFAAETPEGKRGVMAIPVESFIGNDEKMSALIRSLRTRSQQIGFLHNAIQFEKGEKPEDDQEHRPVVAILFYFGMQIEAHYAGILETEGKPILLDWEIDKVDGGRLAAPPVSWN